MEVHVIQVYTWVLQGRVSIGINIIMTRGTNDPYTVWYRLGVVISIGLQYTGSNRTKMKDGTPEGRDDQRVVVYRGYRVNTQISRTPVSSGDIF